MKKIEVRGEYTFNQSQELLKSGVVLGEHLENRLRDVLYEKAGIAKSTVSFDYETLPDGVIAVMGTLNYEDPWKPIDEYDPKYGDVVLSVHNDELDKDGMCIGTPEQYEYTTLGDSKWRIVKWLMIPKNND